MRQAAGRPQGTFQSRLDLKTIEAKNTHGDDACNSSGGRWGTPATCNLQRSGLDGTVIEVVSPDPSSSIATDSVLASALAGFRRLSRRTIDKLSMLWTASPTIPPGSCSTLDISSAVPSPPQLLPFTPPEISSPMMMETRDIGHSATAKTRHQTHIRRPFLVESSRSLPFRSADISPNPARHLTTCLSSTVSEASNPN